MPPLTLNQRRQHNNMAVGWYGGSDTPSNRSTKRTLLECTAIVLFVAVLGLLMMMDK